MRTCFCIIWARMFTLKLSSFACNNSELVGLQDCLVPAWEAPGEGCGDKLWDSGVPITEFGVSAENLHFPSDDIDAIDLGAGDEGGGRSLPRTGVMGVEGPVPAVHQEIEEEMTKACKGLQHKK